ncbi:prenyltransferase/squalene oxidase repeat-containing protein [Methanobacterium petrolearium]|uniref:prenyltransferase/squalene oxidase repeat-containing protein n=1 Tax=Methanobacterium petrolearium TaxID=710190 RepID=UPI001AE9B58B|nr:prenyltransferase/squalene oxidase repeat-containing protein [Methanobacterium petrolearium]MBP1946285.1 hypothetical protein [Methanobacterium petrolearium]BDZ71381.1 hypothetical protein GCM10025861_18980 [Methanobacterium petrolearium]
MADKIIKENLLFIPCSEYANKVLKFVHDREHEDGGFTLYRGLPDTKNTYYGLKILQMFNEEPYNKENTINWIQKLQKDRMYGISGVFYRLNILDIFNEEITVPESYITQLNSKTEFANFEVVYFHTIISYLLQLDNFCKVVDWILPHQNDDGGFGMGRSDIVSTYLALESLNLIDPSLIRMKNSIREFVGKCLTKEGGFTFIPDVYPPYIEPTYAGMKICEILNNQPIKPGVTGNFIWSLQNINGGFRRSKYMGISELEYTFKALHILKIIKQLSNFSINVAV